MSNSQSKRFKNKIVASRLKRPATPKQLLHLKIKKVLTVIGILSLGAVIGITLGTNIERQNKMIEYGGEAYDTGRVEAEKLWWETVVKQTEKDPVNLSIIKIPTTGVVAREETGGSLYCLSTANTDYIQKTYPSTSKCSTVSNRIDNFSVAELEKVIPAGGTLINNGDGSYNCGASKTLFKDKTLKDCITFLRSDMVKQYNVFISEHYTPEEQEELYVGGIG